MSFVLKQFEIGPMQNFGYMIADERTKGALIVDPAWAPEKLETILEEGGYKLQGLIITHAHYDHVNAIPELLKKIDVPVYANKNEIPYSKLMIGIVGQLGKTAKPMEAEDLVKLGDTEVRFLHTPGHTPGSQCIVVGNHLITGDTLFVGGCGRSDLPGGEPETLFQSLQKLARMPGGLEICPGHDYGEKQRRLLSEELKMNPYLRMTDVNQFLQEVS